MLVESLTSDWREVLLHTPFSVTPPPTPFQSENPGIVIMSLVRTHTHTQTATNAVSMVTKQNALSSATAHVYFTPYFVV